MIVACGTEGGLGRVVAHEACVSNAPLPPPPHAAITIVAAAEVPPLGHLRWGWRSCS